MCDAISGIDENILEWFFKFEEKMLIRKKVNRLRKVLLPFAACVSIVIVTFLFYANRSYKISDLEPVRIAASGNASLSGTISPHPANAKRYDIGIEEVESFLGESVENIFKKEVSNVRGFILEYDNGKLHTLSLSFVFDQYSVTVIFDPNNYPKNILDSDKTEQIGDYIVGRGEYYSEKAMDGEDFSISSIEDMIFIAMKNNSMGILLSGPSSSEAELNDLYNYVLKNGVDLNKIPI